MPIEDLKDPRTYRDMIGEVSKTQGVAFVILLGIVLGGAYAMYDTMQWIKSDVAKPLVARQISLMDQLQTSSVEQTKILSGINDVIRDLGKENNIMLKELIKRTEKWPGSTPMPIKEGS